MLLKDYIASRIVIYTHWDYVTELGHGHYLEGLDKKLFSEMKQEPFPMPEAELKRPGSTNIRRTWAVNQKKMINKNLWRARGTTRWMFFIDLDEFFTNQMVRENDAHPTTLQEILLKAEKVYPGICSLEFSRHQLMDGVAPRVGRKHFGREGLRKYHEGPIEWFEKVIVRPDRVLYGHVHFQRCLPSRSLQTSTSQSIKSQNELIVVNTGTLPSDLHDMLEIIELNVNNNTDYKRFNYVQHMNGPIFIHRLLKSLDRRFEEKRRSENAIDADPNTSSMPTWYSKLVQYQQQIDELVLPGFGSASLYNGSIASLQSSQK